MPRVNRIKTVAVKDFMSGSKPSRKFFDHGTGFISEEIPFHASLSSGFQNGGPVHNACADSHIIVHIGTAREQSRRSAFLHVLDMHQLETAAVVFKQLHR